jgi:Tol biopolymer transport system component
MSKRASLHEPRGLTRRAAVVCIGAAAGTVALSASRLRAIEPIPIALPVFLAGATDLAELACSIPGVITANLERSGLFAPLDQAAFIEKIASYDAIPHFVDWRAINAQALVTGRVTAYPTAGVAAAFRLWDVVGATQLGGQQYFSRPDNFRRTAHVISNQIYERLTGEKGYFKTNAHRNDQQGTRGERQSGGWAASFWTMAEGTALRGRGPRERPSSSPLPAPANLRRTTPHGPYRQM